MRKTIAPAILGFLPFLLWEAFSLLYYGALVPNTAYAKLNTATPRLALLEQGGRYLLNSLRWDTVTLVTLVIAACGVVIRKVSSLIPVIAGAILYLTYIVHVGGDYMTGRFLSCSIFLSVIVLARLPMSDRRVTMSIAVAVVILGLLSPLSPVRNGATRELDHGIADYRFRRAPSTGLWNIHIENGVLRHQWAQEGSQLDAQHPGPFYRSTIGMFGFYSERDLHIVDPYALSDPFLARLPGTASEPWRIGHFNRAVPRGYMATLQGEENLIYDPELARYYEQVYEVTRSPLLSSSRLRAIWDLNFAPPPRN